MGAYRVVFLGYGKIDDAERLEEVLSGIALSVLLVRKKAFFWIDPETEFGRIAERAIHRASRRREDCIALTVYTEICRPLGGDGKKLLDPFTAHPDENISELMAPLIEWARERNRTVIDEANLLVSYSDRDDGAVACAKRYVREHPIMVYDVNKALSMPHDTVFPLDGSIMDSPIML